MEPGGSLLHSQAPPPVPILSQINPGRVTHPISWRYIVILTSHLRTGLPSGLFPSGLKPKHYVHLSCFPYARSNPISVAN